MRRLKTSSIAAIPNANPLPEHTILLSLRDAPTHKPDVKIALLPCFLYPFMKEIS